MPLSDNVSITRRFQRSIRIDTDLHSPSALEGFICPRSSTEVLLQLARHVSESGQGAFTWTGPYGSGKSSLVLALSAFLGEGNSQQRSSNCFDAEVRQFLLSALPPGKVGWKILPIVGRRCDPKIVITEALVDRGLAFFDDRKYPSDKQIIDILLDIATKGACDHGGLIVFIDEMGKFLEASAHDGSDIYLFQQLAEVASRSQGKLIIIGILHQAFHEYASRLSRDLRDEWSKVQGRFVDLPVNTAGEEQIELLSRAIETEITSEEQYYLSDGVATLIRKKKGSSSRHLAQSLKDCWPLHPVVACLLGPVSRRRFGQNQRSIFGFLNSAEPHGFQDFIKHSDDDALYQTELLWDYLRVNLEPSILASPDGHRWSLAVEALERCEASGNKDIDITLLKTIALIDLFKERSGLFPSKELLELCCQKTTTEEIYNSLERLQKSSYVIYRQFNDSYSIYAGSDFDIEQAIEVALQDIKSVDFAALKSLAGLHPIIAKRFFHETGALWWFDVEMVPLANLKEYVDNYIPHQGAIGSFLLTIPTEGETADQADRICTQITKVKIDGDLVVGISPRSWVIIDLARELLALEKVLNERTELAGDAVAKREVKARLVQLQGQLETELANAFDNAEWYHQDIIPTPFQRSELTSFASKLAAKRFKKTPKLHNELLNRIKPSSNAVAAQNILLKKMVTHETIRRLGIEGFPAEGGLYDSILGATKLHRETPEGWRFTPPGENADDPSGLRDLWKKTTGYLQKHSKRSVTVSELYKIWRETPFGLKDGLMPVIVVAYMLSMRSHLAFYREGVFLSRFIDLDVEYLTMDSNDIQLRWMDLSDFSRNLLSGMADVVRSVDANNTLRDLQPIDVGRGLISIYDRLHPWTKRTMKLSGNAKRVRNIFKQANDPNKFIFDDIPAVFGGEITFSDNTESKVVTDIVHEGLKELCQAYPRMLRQLSDLIIRELQVPNDSPQALAELRSRAENIKQVAGDFRLEAFIGRIASFGGSDADVESIASLALNKPPRDWIDLDVDRAAVEVTDLAQQFIKIESFARVKGRTNKRHSMAIVVAVDGRPTPFSEEFNITENDYKVVASLVSEVERTLFATEGRERNVILATLAELSARIMQAERCSKESSETQYAK